MTSQGSRRLVILAAAASAALVLVYLALGGSSYEPQAVQDPCESRAWRDPEGVEESAQQFALSALDGAACELHVSRETLVVALGSDQGRERFRSDPRLEAAVRAGLERAIDDAEDADALNPLIADGLRQVAQRAPVDEAIDLVENAAPLFERAQGLLGDATELLPDELQGLVP